MAKLALLGGAAVRRKSAKWPTWPLSDPADARLMAKITKSNRWSYDGPYEDQFARKFTKYHKGKYGFCVANGTVAMQLALEALDVGARDEVIVPGLTWQATAAACIDINAVPVLVDVEPDTWCLDLDAVERAITKKTKAVIVVHLYGCMADMSKLTRLCRWHGLYLIEDCAHQHGSFYQGKGAGTFGDFGTFSFQESKTLSSGEGGFVLCKTREHYERIYSLRNCGRGLDDNVRHAVQSGNYRITEFQAAILLGGLKRLNRQVRHRDANAIFLSKGLGDIPGVTPMRRRSQITQQSYFNFAFRIDPKHFKGLTNGDVSAALNAELGDPGFEPPYEPLNKCVLYKPHTKRRHKIDAAYWKAINPKRFKLPVCKDAHEKSGIVVHHAALMGPRGDMEDIVEAMTKISEQADALRTARRNTGSNYSSRVRW